ncbi:MAG: hypothetical protein Q8J84_06075 [Flavobacteriaceae bacterium]|nr:hypothetical protein [Flavobacteriaceae bacterium]
MKKLALLIIGLGFLMPTISASTINFIDDGYYNNYRPIEFEENDILFFVFPDGKFEFEILYPRHIDLSFRFKNGHVRLGKNLPVRIEQDRYGNIYRIENVFIDYNRFGKVSRIGSVNIYYNHGMIHRMGYLDIVYHPMNRIQYIGYINDNHRHYSYKKSHGRQYSYNDNHMRNRDMYENRDQYDRNQYENSQRDYKEIKHKKEVSYRDNNNETTYKNKQVEPLKKRRPYSN